MFSLTPEFVFGCRNIPVSCNGQSFEKDRPDKMPYVTFGKTSAKTRIPNRVSVEISQRQNPCHQPEKDIETEPNSPKSTDISSPAFAG